MQENKSHYEDNFKKKTWKKRQWLSDKDKSDVDISIILIKKKIARAQKQTVL